MGARTLLTIGPLKTVTMKCGVRRLSLAVYIVRRCERSWSTTLLECRALPVTRARRTRHLSAQILHEESHRPVIEDGVCVKRHTLPFLD